ncbi:hypothetical protein [Reichenbachiella agariperforans]|uniref:hypothetical protein n=1 Tax=Reichenbachiella agariperforans TaxID=156994 RepID=UPI001C08DECE|nr:hypothetical protein [Reichenbachiella agariperforans]MBU2913722.1 hypothetical protein [Reichenbachiella agariperforans]
MEEEIEETNELNQIEDYELFESAIDNFILEIDALAESLPLTIGLIQIKYQSNGKKLDKFFESKTKDNDDKSFKIPLDDFNEFNRLTRELKSSEAAFNILPRTFVVSLVSQYDAYLGEIYRSLFQTTPELIFSLEREMSFSEILKFEDIEELKDHVVEKEIETLLRNSHYEQLKTLEKRITKLTDKDFTLTSQLPILPTFIEVTERRNLFVHCNGLVSRQYLDVCKKHNVPEITGININDQLDVDPLYFEKAYHAIFEVGVKLGQVLWRKFLPEKIEEANLNINSICYDLIVTGYFDLAKELLHFATEVVPKRGSEETRKILMINRALSYYLDGDNKGCLKILNKEDWSIGNEFKLAVAVLKEDYDQARQMMLKIGSNDERLDKDAYQEWPLFQKFRENKIFKDTFKELFKEEFVIRELPEKAFIGLLDQIKKKKGKEAITEPKKK